MNFLNSDGNVYVILVSDSVIPVAFEIPTPCHRDFINYNVILLNIPFDSSEVTIPQYDVVNLIGILLLQGVDTLPCAMLFHSSVTIKLDSNHLDFL